MENRLPDLLSAGERENFALITKNNTLSNKMLKTRPNEYLQNPLTGFLHPNTPIASALLPRGGEARVENPVENVENIHFALYKIVEKGAHTPKKTKKMRQKSAPQPRALRK